MTVVTSPPKQRRHSWKGGELQNQREKPGGGLHPNPSPSALAPVGSHTPGAAQLLSYQFLCVAFSEGSSS